ncbi:MAG: CoA pyrophosphatase [Gemmatimonadota bacterium]|nr:CoA pyrophosphatase [Gemmatimonadota bacterium]
MHALEVLARLERSLSPAAAAPSASDATVRDAAVAVIFRVSDTDVLELLMIERAAYEGDPWSGHVAFPGGRREPHDATLLDTALRETREEIGVDILAHGRVLGALDRVNPVSPSLPPIAIAPFVASLTEDVALALSDEVAAAFWIPLEVLQRVNASSEVEVVLSNGSRRTVRAFVHDRYTIWGLTERIVRDLLARMS